MYPVWYWASQHGDCFTWCGRPGDILPAKWPHSAGDRVSYQPLWIAETGLLVAWQGAGFEVCNTRFSI